MATVHIPDHEWRKQKRKKRLNEKVRDRKKIKINYDRNTDYDQNEQDYEIDEIMKDNFNKKY